MGKSEKNIELKKIEIEQQNFERELELKNKEILLKEKAHKQRLWINPTFIAIIAAVIGLASNAIIAYYNNKSQIEIENKKSEAARILEAIKTGNPDIAAENLEFLLDAGLIVNDSSKIRTYLRFREEGTGARLFVNPGAGNFENREVVELSTSEIYCSKFLEYGIPSTETLNLCRLGYAFGFATEKKLPGWVIYTISSGDSNIVVQRRRDTWRTDPVLPAEDQALNDLYKNNRYDRGHLIPRNDVMYSDKVLNEINLYSVCVPMFDHVNRGAWLKLERLTTNAIKSGHINDLMIISGPLFGPNSVRNYREITDIPDGFFRIAYDKKRKVSSAWIVPNDSLVKSKDLDTYLVSIDEIELLTGYDFFNKFSDDIQNRLESSVNGSNWLE